MSTLIAVRHQGRCMIRTYLNDKRDLSTGDCCIVEIDGDRDYGKVLYFIGPYEGKDFENRVVRKATPQDVERYEVKSEKEKVAYDFCLERINERHLPMKLVSCRYTFDEDKAVFFFTAERRIDFRELVKDLAHRFRIKIEMQQIGVRDEAKMFNGYGPCGKPLCCSQFMKEFETVSIKMAKAQELSLVPSKISGSCNRLKCCLRFEYEQHKRKDT